MEWHCSSNLKWIELKRKDRENLGLLVRYEAKNKHMFDKLINMLIKSDI